MYHAMYLKCGSSNHLGSANFCSFSMQTSVYVSPTSQQRSTANLTSLQSLAHLPLAKFLEVSIVVVTSRLEIFIRHNAHNYSPHAKLDVRELVGYYSRYKHYLDYVRLIVLSSHVLNLHFFHLLNEACACQKKHTRSNFQIYKSK